MTDIWSKVEQSIVASGHESDGWLSDTAYVGDYLPEERMMFVDGFMDIGHLIGIIIETITDNPEEFKKFIEGEK